jgi:D-3-phosphoglycerate dehydrogenase / 2-oxoglutarate reductase
MEPRSIKTLFLPQRGNEHPWLDDVVEALDGDAELVVFDPDSDLAPQFAGVRVAIDQGGHAARPVIDAGAAAGVELWQVLGTGLDHTDVDYILGKDIRLANTPGSFSAVALAEHALFLMLYIAKNFPESDRNIRSGTMYGPINDELAGQTLGLVGLGASARDLAARANTLEMQILAIDVVEPDPATMAALGLAWVGGPEDLPHLMRESDYVSVHVPLSPATHHMIDAEMLALMKPTASVVNVARGAVVDEDALVDALRAGRLRGAGIDTFSMEPPPADHPFLTLENVVATPHVAGITYGTSRRRGAACAENVRRIADGLPPLYEIVGPA